MALVPITLKVEEIAFIPVLRVLHATPGIAHVNFDIDQISNGRGAPRKPKAEPPALPSAKSKGNDLKQLLVALMAQGPQHLAVLKKEATAQGFRLRGVDDALYQLRHSGITESGGVAVHKLTEKALREMRAAPAALPAPEQPPESAPAPRRKSAKPSPSARPSVGTDAIVAFMQKTPSDAASRIALRDVIVAAGLSSRSIDSRLSDTKGLGLIKNVSKGVYELTAKGKNYQPNQ